MKRTKYLTPEMELIGEGPYKSEFTSSKGLEALEFESTKGSL